MSDEKSLFGLTNAENKLFLDVLQKAREEAELKKPRQIREIVDIEEWLEKSYYVGADGVYLYDYWKEHMRDIFKDNAGKYNEIIVTGSLGSGKSTFGLFAMLRKIYELSCFENIGALFDLMTSSLIVFIYFSLTKYQAELTGFGQMKSLLDSIPYFHDSFPRNKKLNSVIKLPENLLYIHGSESYHSIGLNLMGSILDEANFFRGGETKGSAHHEYSKIAELYSSIVNRSKSRFTNKGEDNSLSILISSASHSSSFTEKRIEESLSDPSTKIINAKLWDAKPKGTYSDDYFYMFIGSEVLDPFMIDTVGDVNEFLESAGYPPVNPEYNSVESAINSLPAQFEHLFVAIPEDFRRSFRSNPVLSLMDLAGVSVAPVGKLFSSKTVYYKCCSEDLIHPFYKDRIVLSTGTDQHLKEYLRNGFTFKNIHQPRYVHIDQSETNDSTGIAICHIDKVSRDEYGVRPHITVDLMLAIDPPKKPRRISITKVREFLFFLRDEIGLTLAKVTYDWFASHESIQILDEEGINSERLSVDRSDEQYLSLVNLFFEERISLYDYKPFRDELFDLNHNRGKRKVDHPVGNSKDVADAVAGAVNNAVSSQIADGKSIDSSLFAETNRAGGEDLFTMEELVGDFDDDFLRRL